MSSEKNHLINEAITYATACHAGQVRKGSCHPYILHPLETMLILFHMNADDNLLIAGVLHDIVEDTPATLEEICDRFGNDVASLVAFHTEDKSRSWTERKSAAIASLSGAGDREMMLILADKVSNLRSSISDYREIGEQFWDKFNARREQQNWYYMKMFDALKPMESHPAASPYYREMKDLLSHLFSGRS